MAFDTSQGQDGLTENTAYIIEDINHWNIDMPATPVGTYMKVSESADLNFQGPAEVVEDRIVDLNGNRIYNITGFQQNGSLSSWLFKQSTVQNGLVNVNVTKETGNIYVISKNDKGNYRKLRFTGSLTNNSATGKVALTDRFWSGCRFVDIINELNMSGNGVIAGFSVDNGQTPAEMGQLIFAGTLQDAGLGTATFYGFAVAGWSTGGGTVNVGNGVFWDITSSGTTNGNAGGRAVGKTTAELQTIVTYNDPVTTDGLNEAYSIADTSTHDTEIWKIREGDYPILAWDGYPKIKAGSITFNSIAFSNGVVDWFAVSGPTQESLGTTWIEQVAINSGAATMTVDRDSTKDYFGVARGLTQDFTGTLASAPAGNVINTGLDLTGTDMGAAGDHYIFRATAGAGAGTEVTVTGRTGGDIIVTDASAFATGTEFTLGRFIRGVSRVFPKD